MNLRPLAAGAVILLFVAAGVGAAGDGSQGDGVASLLVDDLVIGESEQQLGPMRAAGFDESVEELVIEIDLGVLERHGVDVSGAEVDLVGADVSGGSLRSATVQDGVVTIVIGPEERGILVDTFRLTGLDTADARAVSDLAYDVAFSAGVADVSRFDIVDPNAEPVTVSPRSLWIDEDDQRVPVEGIRSAGEPVTIELDVTVLEDHGATLDDLEAEAEADGGTVRETTVRGGVVTVVVSPDANETQFDVVVELASFGFEGVETDEGTVASDVTYEARLEGDADETVSVEPFDVIIGPLTAPVTGPSTTGGAVGDAPGFGPVVALVALLVGAVLATRRG